MINFRRLYAIKMKKVKISILLSIFCLTTSGQQINQSTNHNRGGDILEKEQVSVEDLDLNGKNGAWSLEDVEISKKSFNTEYSAKKDYYPFGGLFGESTSGDTQRFKYNGKELDRMHGQRLIIKIT